MNYIDTRFHTIDLDTQYFQKFIEYLLYYHYNKFLLIGKHHSKIENK